MSNTKERIIATALRLFNQHGVVKVTTRKIAEAMDIRHGNLTYHYLKKGQIIEVIYEQMFEEMENRIKSPKELNIRFLHRLFTYYYQFQYRYRFFFLDVVEITRSYPQIAERHLQTQQKRIEEGKVLIQLLVKEGLCHAKILQEDYGLLARMMWFVNNFWMSQQWIFGQSPAPDDAKKTLQMIWQLIKPYFTEKAWEEYKTLGDRSSTSATSSNI